MTDVGGIAADRLRTFIDRIERLEEERHALAQDKSEVFKEAKGSGFDVKAMKRVIQLRRQDPDDRAEQEHLVDLYMVAMGDAGARTQIATRAGTRDAEPESPCQLAEPDAGAAGEGSPVSVHSVPLDPSEHEASPVINSPALPPQAAGGAEQGGDDASTVADPGSAEENTPMQGGAVAARLAHNQEVVGSTPTPATNAASIASAPESAPDDYPDMPDFMRRKPKQREAAE